MKKLNLDTLAAYRDEKRQLLEVRLHPEKETLQRHLLVCSGTGCEANKSEAICQKLKAAAAAKGLQDRVSVVKTGCFGFCAQGPIVKVMPERAFYVQVEPGDVDEIVEQHLIGGKKVERLLYPEQQESGNFSREIRFYQKQKRVVLQNCGVINPEVIDEYIGNNGYRALEKALGGMSPETIIGTLKTSGLRGRGGAGYPTWQKWQFARNTPSDEKYIICNGDEGDPGAYMDRSILEGDPHAVIEAMTLGGFAIGAGTGYVYIRAEYGLAIRRMQTAIDQAYACGLLGPRVLGTDFSFDVEIRLGAGAFVCGEETALIASIEGKRGTPSPRPPFPTIRGLFGKPTVINNVETLANIPQIIDKGGEWFASIGTENSRGTKVFALTGKVNVSGLIEVPMGTTLREIVFDIGGGIANGKAVKAIQTGGPSGGMIAEKYLDTPVDFESLKKLNSMMGSGGMIVIDEDDSMVELAKFYLGFSVDESCGKCAPCRIGGYQMLVILQRLAKGRGKDDDLQKLRDIGFAMRKASLCGLGQTAPNPVLSALDEFEPEFSERIRKPSRRP
jgi:NADH:ubiquinone oxidoreductase subunit F (NADH-binding)/(2Fe-2S) ferredoxin